CSSPNCWTTDAKRSNFAFRSLTIFTVASFTSGDGPIKDYQIIDSEIKRPRFPAAVRAQRPNRRVDPHGEALPALRVQRRAFTTTCLWGSVPRGGARRYAVAGVGVTPRFSIGIKSR